MKTQRTPQFPSLVRAVFAVALAMLACCAGAQAGGVQSPPNFFNNYVFGNFAGTPGVSGTIDGTGAAAQFNNPNAVAVDSAGNVYVADTFNGRIRMITPAGAVTTLTDNSSGNPAQFGNPQGVAVDAAGNVYVADTSNNNISVMEPDGAGSWTVSPLNGSNGQFNNPWGVAVDSGGNVYVADYGNDAIWKITPNGTATTIAGSLGVSGTNDGAGSAAQFSNPQGVAVDTAGNVYVADTGNYTIRKITQDPTGTWTVATLAGSPGNYGGTDGIGSAAQFYTPTRLAVDAAGIIYVADTNGGTNTIRRVTPSGVVTTLAGNLAGGAGNADGIGSAALFNVDCGVAVDANGIVYVADAANQLIRKLTLVGNVSAMSLVDGNGNGFQPNGPSGVAIDAGGNTYIAATGNFTLLQVAPNGTVTTIAGTPGVSGTIDGPGSTALFTQPQSVVVDSATNVYIADTSSGTIRKAAQDSTGTWQVTTLAGSAGQFGGFGGGDGIGSAARFGNPYALALDASGNLYVADSANDNIRKVMPDGTVTTLYDDNGYLWFNAPSGIAVDSGSNIYVASGGDNSIYKLTQDSTGGWTSSTLAGSGASGSNDGLGTAAQFNSPNGLAVDAGGNVYVSDINNATIRKVTPSGLVTTLAGNPGNAGYADGVGSAAQFNTPEGIAVDPNGIVYVADNGNWCIRQVAPIGVVTTLAGSGGIAGSNDGIGVEAQFNGLWGVAMDAAGNLYVADCGNNNIRKVTAGGIITTLAGSPGNVGNADGTGSAASFNTPQGIAVDAAGNAYVTDRYNNTIRKVTPAGVVTTLLDNNQDALYFSFPVGIAVDSGSNIYVSDYNDQNIYKVTQDSAGAWTISTLAGAGVSGTNDGTGTAAQFDHPQGVAADTLGNVYVADNWNHAIRMITPAGVVTTIAGSAGNPGNADGVGTAAQFYYPQGIAVDALGNVYVSTYGYNAIRVMTKDGSGNWTVTTMSRSSGVLSNPCGLAVDTFGDVYVADPGNSRIAIGVPPLLSGSVTGIDATDATLNGLANANGNDATVWFEYGTDTTYGSQAGSQDIGGGTTPVPVSATLSNLPPGTTCHYRLVLSYNDGSGTLYGFDQTFTTPAYSTNANLSALAVSSVALSPAFDPGMLSYTGTVPYTVTSVSVSPTADPTANVQINGNTGWTLGHNTITVLVTAQDGVTTMTYTVDVTVLPNISDAQYAFANYAGSIGVSGGADGTASTAQFGWPEGVAMDTIGNLYVGDTNSAVRKVTYNGKVTTLAGIAGVTGANDGVRWGARFNHSDGVVTDAAGNVYVTDLLNHTIRKVTPSGVVTTLAGSPGVSGTADGTGGAARFNQPWGIGLDAAGNIYVADSANNTIRVVTPGGVVTTLAGTPGAAGAADGTGSAAQFNTPWGIAVDAPGNVYVTDFQNQTIRKVTSGGAVTTLAGSPGVTGSDDGIGSGARFTGPQGVALDVVGNLYVADYINHAIRKVTPAGVVTTIGGTPGVTGTDGGIGAAARFNLPHGVATDVKGNLYVADSQNHRISLGVPQQVTGTATGFSVAWTVLSGSANPNGVASSVWFEYGTDTGYGSQTAHRAIGSGTNFVGVSSTLSGLTAGTTYHYRLGFDNGSGTYYYGTDKTFVPQAGPGYAVNDAVVTGTSVMFSASVNPNGIAGPSTDKTHLGVIWQYWLATGGTTSTTKQLVLTGTTAAAFAPVAVSFTKARSAVPVGIYHYRLGISCTSGTTYGPVQMFSVDPPTLASYPQPAVTGSNAILSPMVDPNGLDTTEFIEYGLTTSYTSGTTAAQDIGSGWMSVPADTAISGLAANTAYHYIVVTVNLSGTTKSADQLFATQAMFGTRAIASKGDAAPGIARATFGVLGIPAINDSDHSAFQATVTGGAGSGIVATGSFANNTGIWAELGTNGRTLIARTGSAAPGYSGTTVGTFATLSDPVFANDDTVAFLGTLVKTGTTAGTVNAANNTGIWMATSGSLGLVARTGDSAPDANGGTSASSPVFASFGQFVLPDQGGVVILGKLKTGVGGAVAANSQGIWGVDTDGLLKQVIRTGDALTVNGGVKIISSLTIFTAPTAATGQTRHFNTIGDLMFKVSFTDGSSGFVQSVFQ